MGSARFVVYPAPRVAVCDWGDTGTVSLAVGNDMVNLDPQLARDVALALIEAAQLVEGGPAYTAAILNHRKRAGAL